MVVLQRYMNGVDGNDVTLELALTQKSYRHHPAPFSTSSNPTWSIARRHQAIQLDVPVDVLFGVTSFTSPRDGDNLQCTVSVPVLNFNL